MSELQGQVLTLAFQRESVFKPPLPEGFMPHWRSVTIPALFGSHFGSFLEA